jgi:signal transduction histidine kinase
MATEPAAITSAAAANRTGKRLFDQVRAANAAVGSALQGSKGAALDSVRAETRVAELTAIVLALLNTLLVLFVAVRTSRSLLSPLQGLRRTLTQLSAGDRTARAREVGPPEMREVIRSLNEMCDESDRLRAGEQRRMALQGSVHDIAARMRESFERDSVLDDVVEALGAALAVDRVYVQSGEAGAAVVERQWHRPELPPLATGLAIAREPGTAVATDARADDPLRLATGAVAYVSAPFGFGDEVFGTIVLARQEPREWPADELALVHAVCADLGQALQHVSLYERERELVDRLRDLDQHKTDFIATVSHELRTPLTSVLGYLEVLTSGDQGPLTDRQLRSLRVIERNAERLGEMVADLLTLSRIESGTFSLEMSPVRVVDAVQRAASTLAPMASGVGLTIEVEVSDDLWTTADPAQLQRVFVNLLGNAIKFSSPGGTIHISGHDDEPDIVAVAITDTGSGIPEAEQGALFEPFHRGSNAVANATQGPGLGLAVVRSIVEQHHGRVSLISEPGQGTTVTVRLPRTAPGAGARTEQAVAGRVS